MICPKVRLQKMLEGKKIPQALLLVGHNLDEIAYEFASTALQKEDPTAIHKLKSRTHPDIHFFQPEGRIGMHTMEQMQQLSREVAFNPTLSKVKFFIVKDADRCLPTGSNALLKTLEEPVSNSVILLLTSQPEKMLPTICSRCQKIVFDAKKGGRTDLQNRFLTLLSSRFTFDDIKSITSELEERRKEFEKTQSKALPKELTLLARERMEKEIEGRATSQYQEEAFSLLETFLLWSRDITLVKSGIESHLAHPEQLTHIKASRPLPYHQVEKMVKELKMAIERSTSLSCCLEALLIRFGYL